MKKAIGQFKKLLDGNQKTNVLIIFLLTVIGAFMDVLSVSLVLPIVLVIMQPDSMQSNLIIKGICEALGISSYKTFIILCIAALIMLYIIKNAFLCFESYVNSKFVYKSRYETQKKILHIMLNKPYEYYLSLSTGDFMRIVSDDVTQSYNLLMTLVTLFSEFVVSACLCITIFIIDPLMTMLVAVMMALLVFVINHKIKPLMNKKNAEVWDYHLTSYKWLLQAVRGIKEIKISGNAYFFEKNYFDAELYKNRALWKKNLWDTLPRHIIETGCIASALIATAVMVYIGNDPASLIPALSAFAMAAVKLMPAASRITYALNSIAYDAPCLDRLIEQMESVSEVFDDKKENRPEKEITLNEGIDFKNISFHYEGSDVLIFDNADLYIPAGQSVGIAGKSGAGKTTAVDILLGLLNPQSGTVSCDGTDIHINARQWLSLIGYIPQEIFMLDGSIKENICFGNEYDEERLRNALDDACLSGFVKDLPDGIETEIGERGMRLSGGQKQRLGIARVLYRNPKLLVFDEATSSLDKETESAIIDSINRLHGRKTMIIIAHRLQTIENCDIIYRIQDGKAVRER